MVAPGTVFSEEIRMNTRFKVIPAVAVLLLSVGVRSAWADDQLTRDGVITGTQDITFNTRTQLDNEGDFREGSAAKGVKDVYKTNLVVTDTVVFSGEIERQPRLLGRVTGRTAQPAKLIYKLDIKVRNPADLKQEKTVGSWVGQVPMDLNTGAYDLTGGTGEGTSPLRIDVQTVGKIGAFKDFFGGKMIGKAEKKDNLLTRNYKRYVQGKEVSVTVTQTDPITFQGVELAKGPVENCPRTRVNGSLDYDYETGNWYANNIKFNYTLDGTDMEDIVSGTIKWVEDENRASNGKGYYEFNLRFNEEKNKPATAEGDAFAGMSDEEAFFAVDNTIPCLTGRIEYIDTFIPGGEMPSSSKVTYLLNANKLTKTQVVNFAKLWLLCVGPTNDE